MARALLPLINDTDRLWGIERATESPAYGKIVVRIIMLWNSSDRRHVVAVSEHGVNVAIKARVYNEKEKRHYFYVEPERCEWIGKLRKIEAFLRRKKPGGWISAPFLMRWGVV